MSKQKVAIVGLGRVGAIFLEGLLSHGGEGLEVVAVCENSATDGRAVAESLGIPVEDLDALFARGESIDVLFDLTGVPEVRRQLREKMMQSGNQHTIIATETIAHLVWSLISGGYALPAEALGRKGY